MSSKQTDELLEIDPTIVYILAASFMLIIIHVLLQVSGGNTIIYSGSLLLKICIVLGISLMAEAASIALISITIQKNYMNYLIRELLSYWESGKTHSKSTQSIAVLSIVFVYTVVIYILAGFVIYSIYTYLV